MVGGSQSLKSYLEDHQILGVEGVDTRALTRYLRDTGAKKAIITTDDLSDDELIQRASLGNDMSGQNLANTVSCEAPYQWKASGIIII